MQAANGFSPYQEGKKIGPPFARDTQFFRQAGRAHGISLLLFGAFRGATFRVRNVSATSSVLGGFAASGERRVRHGFLGTAAFLGVTFSRFTPMS
jgi:hypothetical protein